MAIDEDTITKVAKLARIDVAPEQRAALAGEVNAILGWVEQLAEVGVDGVEPMTSVTPMRLKRRADVVNAGGAPERVLANAPATQEGFFVVPKIVE